MAVTVHQGRAHVFPADAVLRGVAVHHVEIADAGKVRAYLEQHSDLASLLPAIVERARQELGDQAQLVLNVSEDAEGEDRELHLCARLPVYGADLLERLDRISDPFAELLSQVASGSLLVTTDHRRPG